MPVGYPLPYVKPQYFDPEGKPLAAGKLSTYQAGTSTPLPTYTDQALTIPHTNPIILDASGWMLAYVAGGVAYKLEMRTVDDVLLWTADNILVPLPGTGGSTGEPGEPTPVHDPGTIVMTARDSAPVGWLLCDGAAVSRTTYAALFAAIGTKFGIGNGSSTFNVPDMRGRFPLGLAAAGTGSVLGQTGGQLDHTHTGAAHTHVIAAHTHTIPGHNHSVPRDGWGGAQNAPAVPQGRLLAGSGSTFGLTDAQNDNTTGLSTAGVTGGNTAALATESGGTNATGPANPAFTVLNFIVKT